MVNALLKIQQVHPAYLGYIMVLGGHPKDRNYRALKAVVLGCQPEGGMGLVKGVGGPGEQAGLLSGDDGPAFGVGQPLGSGQAFLWGAQSPEVGL
jgi:hypothetical protein